MSKRKLASIQIITNIQPIPEADNIEVVTILGWKVVVRKDQFGIGDYCVYFEIDSVLPHADWNKFLENKKDPTKPIIIKTRRYLGQISQGLAIPLKAFIGQAEGIDLTGADVTGRLGVIKYEIDETETDVTKNAPLPFLPSCISKSDEIRIQTIPDLLKELQGVEMAHSLKMDGASGNFMNYEGEHYVGGRSKRFPDDGKNIYWKMYHKYNFKAILDTVGSYAIQGECCGGGIQKNRMQLKEPELFVFNVYNIKADEYLNFYDLVDFCKMFDLQTVPIKRVAIFNYKTVDELLELANEVRYSDDRYGEGLVIRATVERYSPILNGRASFKVINNNYLLKHRI